MTRSGMFLNLVFSINTYPLISAHFFQNKIKRIQRKLSFLYNVNGWQSKSNNPTNCCDWNMCISFIWNHNKAVDDELDKEDLLDVCDEN